MKRCVILLAAFLLLCLCLAAAAEDGYTLAAENEYLALYVDESTLAMELVDKETGVERFTKVMNGTAGNKTSKNNEKSDVRAYYVVNEFVGTTNSMDSYSMSVSYNNYELNYLENGVEIRYEIGDMTISVEDLPKMVPHEKFKELLLPYWRSKDEESFREFYRPVNNGTQWVRTDNGTIGKVKLQNLYTLFYETGKYTREDLEADNAAFGYEIEKVNPKLHVTVRFMLDGRDLVVTVPTDSIDFTKANAVTRIDLLPYFMTATKEDNGYIFVPDGSGSLIYLNNGKVTALSYTDNVYGNDVLMNVNVYSPSSDSIKMPVYGIKTENQATFAIIEQGAEIASLYVDVADRSDEFNRVYSYFTLRNIEFVNVVGTASGTSPRYPDDIYTGDIVIRYKFLYGDDASYVGMANVYRTYLEQQGQLQKITLPEEAPFFAELIGAVRKTEFFIGIPYESTAVATELEDALKIADALKQAGVKNPMILLNGYLEGGVKHESLADLSLESSTGDKNDLKKLRKHVNEMGGRVYLMLNMEKVYSTHNFSKSSQASRRQDNFVANVVAYAEPILAESRGYTDSFYVSPHYLLEYTGKVVKNLKNEKLSIDGLAVDDLGNLLIGDYRRKGNISRIHATGTAIKALDKLKDSRDVILNAPNVYAISGASAIYNLPDSDNGHKVEDEAIPFIQLVLDDACVYTAGPWNESAYTGVWREMNYAIETRCAPYFRLTYEDETVFLHTEDMDSQNFFMTQYEQWLEEIEQCYYVYNEYWHLVRNAHVVSHDILKSGLRRVRYDNGVTAYVNYLDSDETADGFTIPARGYYIDGGEAE